MDYHEALAKLGIGSAHPGGFSSTRRALREAGIRPGQRVLEVGCGTGRTACELAIRYQACVTALDLRPSMLEKANQRANENGAQIEFKRVIGKRLPVLDASFDFVIVESVTVFNSIARMLSEYARVLVPGGYVLDTEMCAAATLPTEVKRAFATTYGATAVPTMSEWKDLFHQAGFADTRIVHSGSVQSGIGQEEEPDLWGLSHSETTGKEVWSIIEENQRVMSQYAHWLQYATFKAMR
ncbi:MAG: class I SAM-dependent methyltransferase [Firmicutes bacterium]|nr:class I SAM-dependent methyltransferase [Bacillota bacterium]